MDGEVKKITPMDTISVSEKPSARMPRPLFSEVLIKNFLTEEVKEQLKSDVEKLPAVSQEAYFKDYIKSIMKEVEILAVGEDCRALKVGDRAIPGESFMSSITPTADGIYVFVPERAFKGVW